LLRDEVDVEERGDSVTVIQQYGEVVAHRRGARVGRWVRQGTTIVVIDPEFERAPEPEWSFELPKQTPPRPPASTAARTPSHKVDKRLGTPPTVPDRRFASAPLDPQLVELARQYRLWHTDLSEKSFRRNVAVIAYERDGRLHYARAANEPRSPRPEPGPGLHSESVALRKIERGDPSNWLKTRIRGVYSERKPCRDCANDLLFVKEHIDKVQKRRGARGIDFPVHYSVGQWEPGEDRAAQLRARYATRDAAAGPVSRPHRR
jgi:hypothetical protein